MKPERAREALFLAGIGASGWGFHALFGPEWTAIAAGSLLMAISIVGSLRA